MKMINKIGYLLVEGAARSYETIMGILKRIFFSDECKFSLSGRIYRQNCDFGLRNVQFVHMQYSTKDLRLWSYSQKPKRKKSDRISLKTEL